MKPIRDFIGRELRWKRMRLWPTHYELSSGDEVVATITTKGWLRHSAEIATEEDSWLIRWPGPFSRSLHVERLADGAPTAEYTGRLRGGELRFRSGEVFTLSRGAMLPLSIRVHNGVGSRILTVRWNWPSFRNVGRVEVDAAGSGESKLGLLAAFAFHVLAVRRRRAARNSG